MDNQAVDRTKLLEYLIDKLILDGRHLADTAEALQTAISTADNAQALLDSDSLSEEGRDSAEKTLTTALSLSSEYWVALRNAIHDFRSRVATRSEIPEELPQEPFAYFQRNEGWNIWEQVIPEAKDEPHVVAAYRRPVTEKDTQPQRSASAATNTQGSDIAAPAPLVCSRCGADRSKEDCKGDRMQCDIHGTAQGSTARAQFRPRIVIDLSKQRLELRGLNEAVIRRYRIASAANGPGEKENSYCTPRGKHVIRAKIGGGMPAGAVFKGRRPTGEIFSPALAGDNPKRDWILSRILWLDGREPGLNRYGEVDTGQRHIYIHGTPDGVPMGHPSSHGCIRMRNADVIDLFDLTPAGTPVEIRE